MLKTREKFIHSINKFAGAVPTKTLTKITGQNVIFPFYHCISDEQPIHIKHLYKVKSVKQFESDLEFLLKNFKPLDFADLDNFAKNKKSILKPSFLLTFDDGLSQFHDVIAPILLRKGIPAICFLNSDFIDNKALFYRYKASLLVEHFNSSEINNEEIQKLKAKYKLNYNSITDNLLSINFENKDCLDELAEIAGYNFSDYLNSAKPYLTSNQIISLKDKGFHFGSHSTNHPEYRFISHNEQIRQTTESTNRVCQNFSLEYKYFSFPFTDFGASRQFFAEIYDKNIVDLSFGCAGIKEDCFDKNIQRITLEMNNLTAKQIINAELIYYIFRAIFGKNKISRI